MIVLTVIFLLVIMGLILLERKQIFRMYNGQRRLLQVHVIPPPYIPLLVHIIIIHHPDKLQNSGDDPIELQTFSTDLTIYLEDETEVGMDNLTINHVIGQGAFGLVRHAVITIGEKKEMVAVKMLRSEENKTKSMALLKNNKIPLHFTGRANEDELREFIHEIDVMRAVGKHPNIVGLVGHSQTGGRSQQMMILMEYCAKGNLLNFLR